MGGEDDRIDMRDRCWQQTNFREDDNTMWMYPRLQSPAYDWRRTFYDCQTKARELDGWIKTDCG